MVIRTAKFVASYPSVQKCPKTDLPEYAFIGRSNVGKSSLINMLTCTKALAKVSQTPGKTQLINYYLINDSWHLVDLPGYGYAKVSKGEREKFSDIVLNYILKRENMHLLFVLIDSRLEPQDIDIQFINWLGVNQVPFALVFTKTDKVSSMVLEQNIELHKKVLQESWEELPPIFTTSCVTRTGREDVLNYIDQVFREAKITHCQV
ncbi:MAG: ribosome biogenesis GTP-binding protein YihA/YsxC [Tenuifilum sp.]|uniref:ribosome biogenesis GTP-binding protein YihA/YsxC n=1 Tax=Tenuifilum sp. TaxID=2760880 RepID=UPI001B70AB69|nr:YihA family ribosome biogenesis GTP-binding protein [Bacteroidales bacterium]HOK84712.1 ribosome biogenesis GTP-binding protein YihA/YsxC [Tenuifilum sp.]MBP9028377.1 YihA family ribosome biogenesis GTP-binding protein [Bacteroidales bacterium]HOU73781.1 ribosome biogenesis GTP-binding protein YihA/YsxC [Tenuifilum sp.]HPP88963.1 ribosome biogenesis GTP-binding protein YihA/YsxC [Tenuifilum sp.]